MSKLWFITFLFLLSCVPGQEAEVSVEGQESIVNQVRMSSTVSSNIGDWSLESNPLDFTVTLTNNGSKAITNLSASLAKAGAIDGLDYKTTTAIALYPGTGGTCASGLEPKESCTIVLTFEPTQSGRMVYHVNFNYKTLIEKESQTLTFTALAGVPASLTFEDSTSQYDLGIVEQVDDEPGLKRFPLITNLVVENKGELSARGLETSLISTNAEPNAFTVVRNNCPAELPSKAKCEIDVAYTPFNQAISDPEKTYQSSLSIRYGKDQNDKPATLTGGFKVLSTKIEGRFEKSGLQSFCFKLTPESACGAITVGNTATSSFKVINKGYQDAILKKIVLGHQDLLVYCEANGQENLLCYEAGKFLKYNSSGAGHWYANGGNPATTFDETGYECTTVEEEISRHCVLESIDKTPLTLYQFPFLLQDTDLCMTNETRVSGRDILNQGSGRCEVGIKFHPPIYYNKEGQVFNGKEIDELPPAGSPALEVGVIYDSLWKDKLDTYIVSSPMLFRSEPKSLSQALLRVSRFTFGSLNFNYKTPDEVPTAGDILVDFDTVDYFYDLGRYAMVLDSSIYIEARILVKNEGNTRANITNVFSPHGDGQIDIPSKDADGPTSVDYVCSPSGEPFFRTVRHFCTHDSITGDTWIEPKDSCEIRFRFTPVSETNKIYQNYCMYGIPTNDTRYGQSCIDSPQTCNALTELDNRSFIITYLDGVTEDDSLNSFTGQNLIDFHLDASLAASGKLDMAPLDDSNNYQNNGKNLLIEKIDPNFYKYGYIELRNVGSNSIPYIYMTERNNLDPAFFEEPTRLGLSFVQANEHPFVKNGTNNINGKPFKDCYYLVQNKPQDQTFGQFSDLFPSPLPDQAGTPFNNTNFVAALKDYQGNPATPVTALDKGESCILAIRAKTPYGMRQNYATTGVSLEDFSNAVDFSNLTTFLRAFPTNHQDCNGTQEILATRSKPGGYDGYELMFYFYDNDTDTTGGLVPDNSELGNLNYVYQGTETFSVDSEEDSTYNVYPTLPSGVANAMLMQPAKAFPGVTRPGLFSIAAQNISPVYYTLDGNHNFGSFGSYGEAKNLMINTKGQVESDSGEDFNDYDYVLNLGQYPNRDDQAFKVNLTLKKAGFSYDLDSVTYTPIYTTGAGGHKISVTTDLGSGAQVFKIDSTDDATGYHVGKLEYTYQSNIKVENNRVSNPCNNYLGDISNNGDADENLVMLDIENAAKFEYATITKKILVYTKIYQPADTGQLKVFSQDYKVCQDPGTGVISENDPYDNTDDTNCAAAPAVAAETDHGALYKMNSFSFNSSSLVQRETKDIIGDELYSKYRFRIKNEGTQSITFNSISISQQLGHTFSVGGEKVFTSQPANLNSRDYTVVNNGAANYPGGALSGCTGTLAPNESCSLYVMFQAISQETNLTRYLNIDYDFGSEGARITEKVKMRFIPLLPAQINIEGFGTPIATINDTSDDSSFVVDQENISRFRDLSYGNQWEGGTTVDAIRLPLGQVTLNQAPTWYQFHLKLTADSGDLSAYIRQDLFNVDTEGSSWGSNDFGKASAVNGDSRISIDYDPNSPIYPGVPTCAELHAPNSNQEPMNNGESCVIAINYFVDESFINASVSDNANGHEGVYIDYCNNYPGSNPAGCSTGRIYFTFTGGVKFANATTQSGNNLIFSNIEADDSGTAYFEWDAANANTNWSNGIIDYVIKYGGTQKTLSSLASSGNGSIANRWARMPSLINGNYYNFEVVPVVDSKFTTNTYQVNFNQGSQKVKLLVPDDGVEYLHEQELLLKPVTTASNYVALESICDEKIKVGTATVPMQVMSGSQYATLRALDHESVSAFKAYWTVDSDFVDTVDSAEIECLFPDPSIEQNQDFSDSKIIKMIGDTEAAGYKNSGHDDCQTNFLWIPDFFTASSLQAEGVCIYDNLDL